MTELTQDFNKDFDESFLDELEAEVDQSVETQGGTRELPKEGLAYLRFVGYQELGEHIGMYQGKPKAKADKEVRLTFELVHPRHTEGSEYPVLMTLPTLTLSSNAKAKYFKIFKLLTQGDDTIKHLARCLGREYKGRVYHASYKSKKDGKEVTYATLQNPETKDWSFAPAIREDEDTGEQSIIKMPAARSKLQCFIWNKPLMQMWEAMFVDGTRDDGSSKNWIQERCLEAVNFKGSPLQTMLTANNLPTEKQAPKTEEVEIEDETIEEEAPVPAKAESKATKAAVAKKDEESSAPVPAANEEVDEGDLDTMLKEAGLAEE